MDLFVFVPEKLERSAHPSMSTFIPVGEMFKKLQEREELMLRSDISSKASVTLFIISELLCCFIRHMKNGTSLFRIV